MPGSIRILAMAAVAAALAMPVAAQGIDAAALRDLRYRIGALDAELADLRARLERAAPGSQVPRASGGGSDVSIRLDRLEVELGRLTGLVEELDYRQRRMAEDAARRLGDIDFRLTELEGGDIGALAPQSPLGADAGDGGGGGSAAPAPTPDLTPVAPSGGSSFDATAEPAPQGRRAAELELAIADVRQGRFDQGEDRLERYLSGGPAAPAEAEARYWLGQSSFTRGRHSAAARNFLAGYNADRRGPMAPRNLLQLGITLGRLGQVREACLTLREVRTQFPGSGSEILGAADAEADALACGS